MAKVITVILLSLGSCCAQQTEFKDEVQPTSCDERMDIYYAKQAETYQALVTKYGFKEYAFDTETIYGKSDLTEVISSILDAADTFNYKVIREYRDRWAKQYKTIIQIGKEEFLFETTIQSDYIDFYTNYESLRKIAEKFTPECSFEIPNFPGDQTMIVLFGKTSDFKRAVFSGFPLTIDSLQWEWKSSNHQSRCRYISLGLEKIPPIDELKRLLLTTAEELDKARNIPPEPLDQRVQITCFYKENSFSIVVDGLEFVNGRCETKNGTLELEMTPWNAMMAYALAKEFNTTLWYSCKEEKEPATLLSLKEKLLNDMTR